MSILLEILQRDDYNYTREVIERNKNTKNLEAELFNNVNMLNIMTDEEVEEFLYYLRNGDSKNFSEDFYKIIIKEKPKNIFKSKEKEMSVTRLFINDISIAYAYFEFGEAMEDEEIREIILGSSHSIIEKEILDNLYTLNYMDEDRIKEFINGVLREDSSCNIEELYNRIYLYKVKNIFEDVESEEEALFIFIEEIISRMKYHNIDDVISDNTIVRLTSYGSSTKGRNYYIENAVKPLFNIYKTWG